MRHLQSKMFFKRQVIRASKNNKNNKKVIKRKQLPWQYKKLFPRTYVASVIKAYYSTKKGFY